jgi:hypothetical protein
MYISVCYVPCIVIVMFTCTLVRTHPEEEDVRVKLEPLSLTAINSITRSGGATRCMLARRGQSRVQYTLRTRPWRTYSRGATRRPMFKYVHWLVYIYCPVTANIRAIATYVTFLGSAIIVPLHVHDCGCNNNRCLFFRRLKINHDTHEFILDSGTIANSSVHNFLLIFKIVLVIVLDHGSVNFLDLGPCFSDRNIHVWTEGESPKPDPAPPPPYSIPESSAGIHRAGRQPRNGWPLHIWDVLLQCLTSHIVNCYKLNSLY